MNGDLSNQAGSRLATVAAAARHAFECAFGTPIRGSIMTVRDARGGRMQRTASDLLRLVVGDAVPAPVVRADGRLGPAVPLGRRVRLAGRGTTFVREIAGPPGAPTLVLLHGFIASGGLNWFRTFDALSREFHVVAPDLRGHGRGIRSLRQMCLADCADDVAALVDELGAAKVIAAGYSMGGPVAQLLWRRHPDKVAGLVLCATAPSFSTQSRRVADASLATLAGLMRVAGQFAAVPAAGAHLLRRPRAERPAGFLEWAAAEMRRHDVRMLTEAAHSMTRFNSLSWLGNIDVPTAVLRTNRDRAVDPAHQTTFVTHIPGARLVEHDDGHIACARATFTAPMLNACRNVAWRANT
jgi:pimeloyl-ACP methyl ester carboxylesterase